MKITKSKLKQIILEEAQKLNEQYMSCPAGQEQIGSFNDGRPICHYPAHPVATANPDYLPRGRYQDEHPLGRAIRQFFNFEKWYPDPMGFGSTEGEAYRCDPDGTNCYPVESPTPVVPGRMYDRIGRFHENKIKQLAEDVDWGTASSQDLVDIIGDENIAFDAEREMGAGSPDSAYADWLEAYNDPYHPEHDMAVAALPAINPASQDFMYPSKEERLRAQRASEWERIMRNDEVVE